MMFAMKKRYPAAALIVGVALLLTACGRRAEAGATPAVSAAPQETPYAAAGETGEAREMRYGAYRAALTELLDNRALPDGTAADFGPDGSVAESQFAIFDVDGDGREELIVLLASSVSAGQAQYVFDYDAAAGRFATELTEYPPLTFYDNKTVQALWSHNQGLAGSFWPYTLYRYDPAADCYACVGSVDAWEKSFAATDWQGIPFPDGVDKSGAGRVYYIMADGAQEAGTPVDEAEYGAWRERYCGGAAELSLPYRALTRENIESATQPPR